MKDEHVNDAAQGVVEDVPQDVAQDLGFQARAARALRATGRGAGLGLPGPGGARPPHHATTTAALSLCSSR